MGNISNQDFRDFISALYQEEVSYILTLGYSVILQGYSRTTGDMDLWAERSAEIYQRIKNGFCPFWHSCFGYDGRKIFASPCLGCFLFGSPPAAIDSMIKLKGMDFTEAFSRVILSKMTISR